MRRTVVRRKKGGQITSSKSSRQPRVAIPLALAERLAVRRDIAAAHATVQCKASAVWVFPNRAGQVKYAGNFERRTWYPLLTKAGFRHLPPHALRHTYASILIQRGVSLAFIQKQLGHASIQTTVDTSTGIWFPRRGPKGLKTSPRSQNATQTQPTTLPRLRISV